MHATIKLTRLQELETLGVLSAFFLLMGITTRSFTFFYIAFGLLIVGLFLKSISRLIATWWLKFADLLGNAVSRLVLSAIYFLLLTPIAVLSRFFTKDPLMLKPDKDAASFYVERNHTYSGVDLEKMW